MRADDQRLIGSSPRSMAAIRTAIHSEYVENLAVRKRDPLERLFDELVHHARVLPPSSSVIASGFDMGIELTPLSSPIGADLFFPTALPPSEALANSRSCVISANAPSSPAC